MARSARQSTGARTGRGKPDPGRPSRVCEVTQERLLRFTGCDKALCQHSHMMLVFSLVELGAGFVPVTPHSFG